MKVLLVGWASADWKLILPLLDAAALPNLGRLVNGGVIGKLTAVEPSVAEAIWTSAATGKRPHAHGILGPGELAPGASTVRPVTCLGRSARPLWSILDEAGKRSLVVGWPASHPAEPYRGAGITDRFFATGAPDCVHPVAMHARLADLRIHPGETRPEDILPFVPGLKDAIAAGDPRIQELRGILAETATVHAAATELLSTEASWDFAAVVYPGLDRLCRRFLRYAPPRAEFITEQDFERYRRVIETGYRFHDLMLGALLRLAGEETTVLLMSDQGVPTGDDRSHLDPGEPGSPIVRQEVGTFVLYGPQIRSDELRFGTSVLDLAPTILHALGVAVGRDMEGRVLLDAFTAPGSVVWVDSWEGGTAGLHPAAHRFDARHILSAGPERDAGAGPGAELSYPEQLVADLRFQFAEAVLGAGREDEAIPLLEALWRQDPAESRYGYRLMHAYLALGRPDLAEACLERFFASKKRYAATARRAWRELEARDPQTLSPYDRLRKSKLWKQSRSNISATAYLRAWIQSAHGRREAALETLALADVTKVYNPRAFLRLRAECLLALKRPEEASAALDQALALDPQDADTHCEIARVRFEQERFAEAAESAATSFAIRYFNPRAHYVYGASMFRLGKPDLAVRGLEIAVQQAPHMPGAYDRLALLHRGLGNAERAAQCHAESRRRRRERTDNQARRSRLAVELAERFAGTAHD